VFQVFASNGVASGEPRAEIAVAAALAAERELCRAIWTLD
jgi:hypothetical protein